jgi:alginate O-acetyltransferase complex protein AlgJ
MFTLRNHAATLLLPMVVFGYAAYSNASLLLGDGAKAETARIGTVSISGVLDGDVTHEFDSLYKNELPHRNAAIGLGGNARYALFGTGRKGVIVGADGWLFTNEEFKQIGPADIKDAVQHIADAKARLDSMGITLVVLPLPAKSDVYGYHLPERMKSDVMSAAYFEFLSALKVADIHTADARSALVARRYRDEVFLKSDTHWSPVGAQIASEATAAAISALGIELDPETVRVVSEAPVSLWGDLTKFITSPEYASEIGLRPEIVALFRTQMQTDDAGLDLFGEQVGVPVVLVGTSYSANENWSFVDFLRQSLSTDVVNVAKEGLGPGVPMMDLLNSDTLNTTPPKIVVWEFPVRYLGGASLWERKNTSGKIDVSQAAGGGNV